MSASVRKVVTSGQFHLDGGSWDVDNNVWILGDESECLIIDAAHDAEAIAAAAGQRRVTAIVCTHAHDDHIDAAVRLRELTGAPILLHPADTELWHLTYASADPDTVLSDGQILTIAGTELRVLATPGHTPGGVCLYAPQLGCVFSGDTLFQGGPGATGRSYSDYATLRDSIRERLFALDDATVVHTGHGDDTTIGAERGNVPDEKEA